MWVKKPGMSASMTERKNLKVREETYDRLRDAKGQYETWDGFFHRVLDES